MLNLSVYTLKRSVILEITLLFVLIIITLKIKIIFALFLKNIIKLSIHWIMGTSTDLIISVFSVSTISREGYNPNKS